MAGRFDETLLTAAECARRTGLTVRALRVYETRGLIRPIRTEKGWRLYSRKDLERLAAVGTLKMLGLSLAEIGGTLSGAPDLAGLLRARIDAWQALVDQARDGLDLSQLAIERLCELVRSMNMTKMPRALLDLAGALHTPEEREQILARKMAMVDDPTFGQGAWAVLIAEIKDLIAAGTAPADPAAQAAARRWVELVKAFSGGDAGIEAKGKQFWEQALDQDPDGRELPFGKAEWEFVASAMRAAA